MWLLKELLNTTVMKTTSMHFKSSTKKNRTAKSLSRQIFHVIGKTAHADWKIVKKTINQPVIKKTFIYFSFKKSPVVDILILLQSRLDVDLGHYTSSTGRFSLVHPLNNEKTDRHSCPIQSEVIISRKM